MRVPVFATTSPAGTPADQAGILPAAQTVLGGQSHFGFMQAGFRLRGGHRFDGDACHGLSWEFLTLFSRGHNFAASSQGAPILARPFTNLQPPGGQDAQIVAFPGLSSGTVAVNAETRFYSMGLHYWADIEKLDRDTCGESTTGRFRTRALAGNRFRLQVGPRFSHLDDTLLLDEALTSVASGRTFRLRDSFKTENSFFGGEIGLQFQRKRRDVDMDLGLRLAIGGTRQELNIDGINSATSGTAVTTNRGGFYAHESNSGGWDRTRFSLIPSLDAGLSYENDRGWLFSITYSLTYWTNVLRAGEQIDTGIDERSFLTPTPAPVPGRPLPLFRESDYLAHGISLGLEKRY